MTFFWSNDPFIERLQQCAGSPWTLIEAQSQLDPLVLQLPPLLVDSADPMLFLDFLADMVHRRLVQCFLGAQTIRQWTFEALLKQARPPSPQALFAALERCCFWQIAIESSSAQTWQGHPRLMTLNNL